MVDLDAVADLLNTGSVTSGMAMLFEGLSRTRAALSKTQWNEFVASTAMPHRLRQLVHQDPCTRRGFEKPRGYPGDAVLLDYLYDEAHEDRQFPETRLGTSVQQFTTAGVASRAVKFRRHYLATLIDDVAGSRPEARVLAVAAGHFREGESSLAVQRRNVAEVIAIDQDLQTVLHVQRTFARNGVVRATTGSVRDLIARRAKYQGLDLAYAAGLFDYLSAPVARRLIRVLFDSLREGGTLLIANFTPLVPDVGYMEAYMDWHLTYRSDAEMMDLVDPLPKAELDAVTLSHDPDNVIVFCRIGKN